MATTTNKATNDPRCDRKAREANAAARATFRPVTDTAPDGGGGLTRSVFVDATVVTE